MRGDDYETMLSSVEATEKEIDRIMDYFGGRSRYYSQWDTEEDYNTFVAQQKEHEDMLNFNLTDGEREIEELYAQADTLDWASHSDRVKMVEISDLITQKKAYMENAKRAQEGVRMGGVADPESEYYDPEFSSKAGYISTESNGWGKLTSQYGMGYDDLVYEYINGGQNGMRDKILSKNASFSADTESEASDNWKIYDHMTDDEISIYNYYYNQGGKEAADKYLDSIQKTLNYRSAQARYGKLEDNVGLELLFGAEAGLDQFSSGVKSLFSDEHKAPSDTQILSGMVREDLENAGPKLPDWMGGASLGQVGYDTVTTSANMAPSILTSLAIGAVSKSAGAYVGNALLGASAAGSAYQEKLNQGYTKEQASAYGTMIGLSEVLLEKLLGGITPLGGGGLTEAAVSNIGKIDNILARLAKSAGGRIVMNASSEAFEEGLQAVLEPFLWQAASGIETDVNWEEAAYSALLGFATGGMFEAGSTAIDAAQTQLQYKQLYGESQQELVAKALELNPDNAFAKKMQERLDSGKNLSGSQLNKLVQQNDAAIKKQRPDATETRQDGAETVAEAAQTEKVDTFSVKENNALEGAYGASEDGKAYFKDKPINIVGVASVKDSSMKLKLEDGRVVDAKEVQYSSADEAVVYETVAGLGVRALGANMLIENYTPGGDVSAMVYAKGIEEAYMAGKLNIPMQELATMPFASDLAEYQRQAAYQLGELFGGKKQSDTKQAETESKKTASNKVRAVRKRGIVKSRGISTQDWNRAFNSAQKDAYSILDRIAHVTGIDIILYQSKPDAKGNLRGGIVDGIDMSGSQGGFSWHNDKIYIDINAGVLSASEMGDVARYSMLRTFTHEFTHFIEKYNAEHWGILRDAVFSTMRSNGVDPDLLINEYMDNHKGAHRDTASQEVVAEAMVDVLPQSNFVEELALKHRNVFETLLDKLKEFVEQIRAHFKTLGTSRSKEPAAVKEYVDGVMKYADELVELFDKIAVQAVENYQAERMAQKNTAPGDGVQMQARPSVKDPSVLDPKTVTKADVAEMLENVKSHKYADNTYIPVRISTPGIVQERLFAKDLPIIMPVSKVSQAFSHDNGPVKGKNVRGHGLSVGQLIEIVERMDSPDFVYSQDNGRGVEVIRLGGTSDNTVVIVEFDNNVNPAYMNGYEGGTYNVSVTTFNVDGGNVGLFMYSQEKGWHEVFNKQKEGDPAKKFPATRPFAIEQGSLNDNVPQQRSAVNNDSSGKQHQDRTGTMTDWDVLERASSIVGEQKLTTEQQAALDSFNSHLENIKNLAVQKAQQHSLMNSATEDGKKTARNRIVKLNQQIKAETKAMFELQNTPVLKRVLQKARTVIEDEQATKRREAVAEYRDRRNEDQKKAATRGKIKAFKSKLERSLLHPSDSQYIPIDLIRAMIEVCGLIDTDTELYRADGSINKAQERRNLTKEKLLTLEDEYKKLKKHSDPIYAGEFDEMVYTYLSELREKYTGKNLNDMSLDELAEMYETLRAIDETLQDARKLIGWGDAENIREAGDTIIAEQAEIFKKNGKRSVAQKARDASLNGSLSPVRNVERMSGYNTNSPLLKLFKRFELGVRKKNKFVMDAYKSFEELTSSKEYDDAIYKEVAGLEFVDIKGRKFGVSKMQMMQAILSFEREAANGMAHIKLGGFTFADLKMLQKGRLKDAISAEYAHRIPAAGNMVGRFTEVIKNDKWCQDYMAAARKFFNEAAKDAINETSVALKHRIIAKEKSYIPFEVDQNFVNREISAEDSIQATINSYGMLKETKNKAPQPLIITGLNNVLDRHIDAVGNVYGLAIEVRNFNKVWNLKSQSHETTVKDMIETNWGKGGVNHIEQAVKDIQGPRIRERSVIYDKIKSGYISSTFLLNLSVVTKQIGSLFSATSMLRWRDPVRMGANLFYTMVKHKKISAEVDKYTATAWMRRQGLSDAELHTFLTEGKKSRIGKFVGKLPAALNPGKWIAAMDHTVALSLWKYAKIDIAKRTGLKGEELLKATAEFYDEVIENTQSMSDVLHRPEIQKRKDPISEAFAMFKTDLYQMAGQLEVATGRFVANRTKENGAALGRTVYAIAASAVWGQLMTTLFALLRYKVNQYRDEDDENLTAESWLKRQGFRLAGDLLGYIAPIFGSELVGIFENIKYGESEDVVDNIVLTAINDLTDIMITVGSALDDGKMPSLTDMRKIGAKAFRVFGIPVSNILRTLDAIHLHAKDIANGEFFSFEAGVERTSGNHIHRIVEAVDAGKMDVAAGLFEEAVEELALRKSNDGSCGEDEMKAAKSDLVTALGDKYKDGKVSEETASEILSELCEKSPEEVKGKISYWDSKIADPDSDTPSQWYVTYYEKIESSGIDLNTYVTYRNEKAGLTKRDEVLEIIDAQPISDDQKDALYFAEGYAESTLDEAPWH